MQVKSFDHPIFTESIRRIRSQLDGTGLDPLQQDVLERLIHSSGDFGIQPLLRFSAGACDVGLSALKKGALILTDTAMASAAIKPMAKRTGNSRVRNVLEWAPDDYFQATTRTAVGMELAWQELSKEFEADQKPIVAIGSSPTALMALLELVSKGAPAPSLIVGMPVGFVDVLESKLQLNRSGLNYISLEGTRGGAGLAASVVNTLLRASFNNNN